MQDYWLPTPFASFPFTSPPVSHRVPSGSERAVPLLTPLFYKTDDDPVESKHVAQLLVA